MNAGEISGRTTRTTVSSSSNTRIAKKARTKAEVDFATWPMMAKLGGFDDLPSNAQGFLTNYRIRLETMSEADPPPWPLARSTALSTARWEAWAPEPKARTPRQKSKSCGLGDR
jgi:hypothetical protein